MKYCCLKTLGVYVLAIYAAMFFHFIFIQMGLLLVNKISPIQFIKNFGQAMTMAFVTQSSYGTMPVSIRVLEDNMGVSPEVANFVAPPIGCKRRNERLWWYISSNGSYYCCKMFIIFHYL